MKTPNPASITATFVSAILSLVLPASALSTDDSLRHVEPARARELSKEEGARNEPFRGDPIVESPRWGPGDPGLVISKFQLQFPGRPKDVAVMRAPPSSTDGSDGRTPP